MIACGKSYGPKHTFDLAFEAFPVPEGFEIERGDSTGFFRQGMESYAAKDYNRAIDYFQRHLEQADGLREEANFFLAIALLTRKQGAKAAYYLRFFKAENKTFSDATKWYLCMAYLADDRMESAHIFLLEMANDAGHAFQRQAAELLKKVE